MSALAASCTPQTTLEGLCPTVTATTDTDHVDLTGIESTAGSADGTDAVGGPNREPSVIDDCFNPVSVTCPRPIPVEVSSPVTLEDIASFRPTAPVDRMQPDGWTVAGLHTNFYAGGSREVVDGVLLGSPAQVRFTPVRWTWYYGDGTSAGHPVAGDTWEALGLREFDATPTSHVFAAYGSYVVDLDVTYAAEYRYDGGAWVPVVGALVLPANPLSVSVGSAKTVLVGRECTRNPRGPGC